MCICDSLEEWIKETLNFLLKSSLSFDNVNVINIQKHTKEMAPNETCLMDS